jgi:glycosyltransferase involved in cell wall biosynthesis
MRGSKIHVRMACIAQAIKMVRVLLVSGSSPPAPCGVGDYTFRLAESLESLGDVEAAILTSASVPRTPAKDGVQVFPIVADWRLRGLFQVVRFLRLWKPDIVHVQFPTQGYQDRVMPSLIPLAARVLGIRTVQTWHEGFSRSRVFRLIFQLAAASRQIVVRSNFTETTHPSLRWAVRLANPDFVANASSIPRARFSDEERISIRRTLLDGQTRLIVFFGFLYPAKGVDLLFEIADAHTDRLVIAGAAIEGSSYFEQLKALATSERWNNHVKFEGFVSPERAALLLAAADAVILPFRQGGGEWNTSIHSAVLNGAFVITTSSNPVGFDERTNIYYAHVNDVADMRAALALHGGRRRNFVTNGHEDDSEWRAIARRHRKIYAELRRPGA